MRTAMVAATGSEGSPRANLPLRRVRLDSSRFVEVPMHNLFVKIDHSNDMAVMASMLLRTV